MLETLLSEEQCGADGSKSVSIGFSSASSPSYRSWRFSARMPITSLRRSGVLSAPPELRTSSRVLMSCAALCATTFSPSSAVASAMNAEGESACTPYAMSRDPSLSAAFTALTLSYDLSTTLSYVGFLRWPANLVKSTSLTVAPFA